MADLSAVQTLQLLPGRIQATAREQLPGLAVSRDAARDAFITRDEVRSLNAQHLSLPTAPDGPQPAAAFLAHLGLLTRQAEYLETVAGELACPVPATRTASATEAGIAAAIELGLPLW